MEKVLQKIARQLSKLDEASLMSLWQKYAEKVRRFEPSERWEEAVLILGIIQTMRFKNQLFNHHWLENEQGRDRGAPAPIRAVPTAAEGQDARRGKVLRFPGTSAEGLDGPEGDDLPPAE